MSTTGDVYARDIQKVLHEVSGLSLPESDHGTQEDSDSVPHEDPNVLNFSLSGVVTKFKELERCDLKSASLLISDSFVQSEGENPPYHSSVESRDGDQEESASREVEYPEVVVSVQFEAPSSDGNWGCPTVTDGGDCSYETFSKPNQNQLADDSDYVTHEDPNVLNFSLSGVVTEFKELERRDLKSASLLISDSFVQSEGENSPCHSSVESRDGDQDESASREVECPEVVVCLQIEAPSSDENRRSPAVSDGVDCGCVTVKLFPLDLKRSMIVQPINQSD
ncbi:hypothetical protein R1flu_022753 [Riccia fluitans]|uniref:Uncharacterized protein n=1 Tax=Riccia fluitans TaxID=41844 RepID=A0ABD1XQ52_9MARC